MRRRISFPKRVLAFEALEQKRPLAIEVLSCGDADPDAVIAEDSGTQDATKSADQSQNFNDEELSAELAAQNEVDELKNEKSSNGLSPLNQSAAGQVDEESDVADEVSSDDDDDEAMDDDSDEEENGSDEEVDESDENDGEESDDEDSDDDSDDDDEEDDSDDDSDDDDESEEVDDDDVEDEEDQDDDDSDEEEDESEEDDDDLEDDDDQTDDDDESEENDNDSEEDDQDELEEENDVDDSDENKAEFDAEPMQSSVEREAMGDDANELTPTVGLDVAGGTPAIIGFLAVENNIQRLRSLRLSDRQLVDEDLIELLQVQPGNPSRDGRDLAFDGIVDLANRDTVETAGPFISDELNRVTLQGPLQPAFVDAVFTSLD